MPRWAMALLAAVVLGSGCPRRSQTPLELPLVTSDDPEAEAELDAARARSTGGDAAAAEEGYRSFLREHPDDPLAAIARLELARLRLAEGAPEEARELLAPLAAHEDQGVGERARFYEGVALHLLGDHQGARDRLTPFVGRTVDPEETATLLTTLAAAADALGDQRGAVSAWDRLASASVAELDRQAARRRLADLVPTLPDDAVRELEPTLPREGPAWALLAPVALRVAIERGERERALNIATALRERGLAGDDELGEMVLRAERSGATDLRAIGAVLPLSGRGREVGRAALEGLMVAAGVPPSGPPSPNAFRLHFRDSAGDADAAARAVEDLVTLHQVVAIVGPVDGAAARAAGARAAELGVPLLALHPDAQSGAGLVFRAFPSPEEEAAALVRGARARGATRLAVLHPAMGYGERLREAFASAAAAADLTYAGAVSYAPGTTSFREPLEALGELRFDALALPDAAGRILLVAPALAAVGVRSGVPAAEAGRVQLLVPSVGLRADVVRSAGRYLQGALFAYLFHAPSASGEAALFRDAYAARFGRTPDGYAAAARDGFALVRRAVEAGATSRAEVAGWLRTSGGAATASALGGFADAQGPARGTALLELAGPVLQPVALPRRPDAS
ncbi:MAG: ABC transporter substrate-binding protein [Myxococcota bacterium]